LIKKMNKEKYNEKIVNDLEGKDEVEIGKVKLTYDSEPNKQKMTLKGFKRYCDEFDDNISDKLTKDSFGVRCKVCDSENVQIMFRRKVISEGSEYTGCWTSTDMGLLFKCYDCGNAIAITDEY